MAMPPSSTVHGDQYGTKYVTFELLLRASFVAEEIWGDTLKSALIEWQEYHGSGGEFILRTHCSVDWASEHAAGVLILEESEKVGRWAEASKGFVRNCLVQGGRYMGQEG